MQISTRPSPLRSSHIETLTHNGEGFRPLTAQPQWISSASSQLMQPTATNTPEHAPHTLTPHVRVHTHARALSRALPLWNSHALPHALASSLCAHPWPCPTPSLQRPLLGTSAALSLRLYCGADQGPPLGSRAPDVATGPGTPLRLAGRRSHNRGSHKRLRIEQQRWKSLTQAVILRTDQSYSRECLSKGEEAIAESNQAASCHLELLISFSTQGWYPHSHFI